MQYLQFVSAWPRIVQYKREVAPWSPAPSRAAGIACFWPPACRQQTSIRTNSTLYLYSSLNEVNNDDGFCSTCCWWWCLPAGWAADGWTWPPGGVRCSLFGPYALQVYTSSKWLPAAPAAPPGRPWPGRCPTGWSLLTGRPPTGSQPSAGQRGEYDIVIMHFGF